MNNKLPPRTVERLSKYRRLLDSYKEIDEAHIHSHRLAAMLNLTPEQVRRDLMLIGLNGNHRKGYNIKAMIGQIGNTIDKQEGHKLAIVGIGNLGRAVLGFIKKSNTKMNVVAAFDIDTNKTHTEIAGVLCYDLIQAPEIIKQHEIRIAILTVPPEAAVENTELLINAGIKGILNFTSVHLDVPKGIYLKDYDIITSLEEIGFFIMD